MSTTITIRLEEQEKNLVKECAKANHMTISEWIRIVLLEQIEDEYDLKSYSEAVREDSGIRYSHEDMLKAFGISKDHINQRIGTDN